MDPLSTILTARVASRGVAIGGDEHGSVIITGDGSSVRKT